VIRRLITSSECTTNLDTKLIILLGSLGSNDRETSEDLSGDGSVIGFQRHYIYVRLQNFKLRNLSDLKE